MLDAISNAIISTFDLSSPDTFRMISSLMILYVATATPLVGWVAYDLLRKKPQKLQVLVLNMANEAQQLYSRGNVLANAVDV